MNSPSRSRKTLLQALSSVREWFFLLIWPAVGLLIISLIAVDASTRADLLIDEGEQLVRSKTRSLTNSYAQQLMIMVEQIDQITLRMKNEWENPDTPVNLEQVKDLGLFPQSPLLYASIFDGAGTLITSTLLEGSGHVSAAAFSFFQMHQANCCLGLRISTPPFGKLVNGRLPIHFSRRLDQLDGSFGGVAVVSADPFYLAAFQETTIIGESDFITLSTDAGSVLTSKVGVQTENTPMFYIQPPYFFSREGSLIEAENKFYDQQTRFVAWKKVGDYPLYAVTGLSIDDAMAPYRAQADALRHTTLAQGILIMAFSLAGTLLTAFLFRRSQQAEKKQNTYRLTTDAAKEGFYVLKPLYDRQGKLKDFQIEDCNNHAAELLGITREKLLALKIRSLAPPMGEDMFSLFLEAHQRGMVEEEVRVSPRSPLRAKWIYRRMVRSELGLAVTIRDISEEKVHEQALADLANTDTLTRLPNRNWLHGFLPDALRHASYGTGDLALLFIDLDNFKNVNDTLGHDAGDELLVQATHRLKQAVRASDHVARLGGDEFIVILEHVETEEDIARVAGAIVQTIEQPFSLATGMGNAINASIGISIYPRDGMDSETLLKHADIAMYAAKAAGKGRYTFYQPHLSDSLLHRLSKEHALKEAVENHEFVVHYQPRVDTTTGILTSMEALARWHRPGHGLVYPGEFIDTAEDLGLIIRIGESIIEQVCRQIAAWKAEGLDIVPVSINISPKQLKSGTVSAFLIAALARYQLEPRFIEAELTESAVIDNSLIVESELSTLRRHGIKLMIDDFGTGYSSMAQLYRLDVDALKIDRGFIKALTYGNEGIQLFRAIGTMADALDMDVVAEGVETMEEFQVLQSMHCDEIQGFIISEAVTANRMAEMIIKRFLLPSASAPVENLSV